MRIVNRYCVFGAIVPFGILSAAQGAETVERDRQTRIPFAELGGIRNWQAEESDTLFVQSRRGQWYRAELAPCFGLPVAHTIGFVFEFDHLSSIVVDGRECRISSLVKSVPPAALEDRESQQRAEQQSRQSDRREEQEASTGDDARIPFAHLGGIENWRAIDDDTLYIEGRNDKWYRAELRGNCPGLKLETSIGFVTEPVGGFDEFSSIVVDGRECHLKSLAQSEPPSGKK